MKKIYTVMAAVAAIFLSFTLTSCEDDWGPGYPPGPGDTFYDTALTGCYWELYQVNSSVVDPDEVNILEFFNNGRGYYYELENGRPFRDNTSWWCQWSNNSTSDYQINLIIEGKSPSTMNYWFTHNGNYLWMQWYNRYEGTTTYVYRAVDTLPYPF